MTKDYMLTIPQHACCKKMLKIMIEENDIHKWIIARETGKNGYRHWQIRLRVGNNSNFYAFSGGRKTDDIRIGTGWVNKNIPHAHVEECSDTWEYERKGGDFWSSEDTVEILKVRYGKPTQSQKRILHEVANQNNRQVDVYYDSVGSHGKSWLSIYLYERGLAFIVPRFATTARGLSQYICSSYRNEGIIIIDIPRSGKPTKDLYEAIEEVKDGLVFDERYHGKTRNVRGAKVLIFTNNKLDLKALSKDRWRIHGISGDEQIAPTS